MSPTGIVVVAEQEKGEPTDVTLEMLACGRELADRAGGPLTCLLLTDRGAPFRALPLAADRLVIVEDPALGAFNPEVHARVLAHQLKAMAPALVLLGNTAAGMDLAGPLSLLLGGTAVSGCVRVALEGGVIVATSRLYGGKLLAEVSVPAPALVLLMPGSYPRQKGMRDRVPKVEVQGGAGLAGPLRVRSCGILEPKAEDVDLRKVPVLVGAGRGVQTKDNLRIVEDLARALGGAVCATRPVVDQGWLPRSRQVGRSGLTVKPRLYLALGISGAPEHVEGMKEADLVVAVNTDAGAPIFDVAQYGATVDILDLVPILTEKLKAAKGGK
ncbi:MAG: hypothetical protein A3K65_01830 [Euryarchaeota archaeon RBG_16_68_12]|nr:MAG: hypothetical protein A3K65_01830 [Euryarchaeota archaeon RBG_16_68_12]